MITGRINPHEEPTKYQTYQGDYDDWNDGRNNFDDLSDDLGY